MKNKDVVQKLLDFHPQFPADYDGCDNYKSGDPEAECKGITTALTPTIDVIRKTYELGCNLLIVHEPTFYSTPDFPTWRSKEPNKIYEEKKQLLEDLGITIWRDHDHMHAHKPDCIFTGVEKYLGWGEYRTSFDGDWPMAHCYQIPEITVAGLAKELKEKIGLNGLRVIGNPTDVISKVAIVGHLLPQLVLEDGLDEEGYWFEYSTKVMNLLDRGADAIIPGEVIDWTALSYIRDAVMLGKNKAAFNIGHFGMEELGMKYAAEYISDLVENQVPVHYIPSGDMYRFDM